MNRAIRSRDLSQGERTRLAQLRDLLTPGEAQPGRTLQVHCPFPAKQSEYTVEEEEWDSDEEMDVPESIGVRLRRLEAEALGRLTPGQRIECLDLIFLGGGSNKVHRTPYPKRTKRGINPTPEQLEYLKRAWENDLEVAWVTLQFSRSNDFHSGKSPHPLTDTPVGRRQQAALHYVLTNYSTLLGLHYSQACREEATLPLVATRQARNGLRPLKKAYPLTSHPDCEWQEVHAEAARIIHFTKVPAGIGRWQAILDELTDPGTQAPASYVAKELCLFIFLVEKYMIAEELLLKSEFHTHPRLRAATTVPRAIIRKADPRSAEQRQIVDAVRRHRALVLGFGTSIINRPRVRPSFWNLRFDKIDNPYKPEMQFAPTAAELAEEVLSPAELPAANLLAADVAAMLHSLAGGMVHRGTDQGRADTYARVHAMFAAHGLPVEDDGAQLIITTSEVLLNNLLRSIINGRENQYRVTRQDVERAVQANEGLRRPPRPEPGAAAAAPPAAAAPAPRRVATTVVAEASATRRSTEWGPREPLAWQEGQRRRNAPAERDGSL